MVPKRTRSHQLESQSFIKFESYIPSQWVFRRKDTPDYGIDGEIEIFDDNGQATGNFINVQLKSTDSKDIKKCLKEKLRVDTLEYYSKLQYPVLIAKYSSHLDKIFYRWAHSKRKNPIKEGQKEITLHFSEDNIVDSNTFQQLESDVINYINFHKKKLVPPFKMYLTVDANYIISKSAIALKFKSYGLQHKVCMQLCDKNEKNAIGKISISSKNTLISIGGDSVTFLFPNRDKDYLTEDAFIADVSMAFGILIDTSGNSLLASKLISPIFKKSLLFEKGDFIVGLLSCFYNAGAFNLVLDASKWAIEVKNQIEKVNLFSCLLYRDYNRSVEKEKDLIEELLLLIKKSYSEKGMNADLGVCYYNLGNFYGSLDKYFKAISHYNKARRNEPSYNKRSYFWYEIGMLLFNSGRNFFACNAYKKSLSLKNEFSVRAKYADALIHIGKYTKGIEELQQYCDAMNQNKELYWCLKLEVLDQIKSQYNIKDGKREVTASNAICCNHKSIEKENIIKAISLDLLNHYAWFSMGLVAYEEKNIEDSLWAFLWSAMCSELCVDAWGNAFSMTLGLPKSEQVTFLIASIFQIAYEINQDKFIYHLFDNIDKNTFINDKEAAKNHILEMANHIVKNRNFEFRLIDGNNKVETVKLTMNTG